MIGSAELIFVYNANSGKWNAYMDTLHKLVSPKTYPCSLCDITFEYFGIKEEWAKFKETVSLPMRFLHKNEWQDEFDRTDNLPAVFLKEGENLTSFLEAERMNQVTLWFDPLLIGQTTINI